MSDRPRLLDLYCCAGGASTGYQRAGFDVVGVDINPQPRYPHEFIKADALDILADRSFLDGFDAVAASPPCQKYTPLGALHRHKTYPDLIAPTRDALTAWGGPFVIENVMAAPLDKARSVVLCGCMFGLRTYRRRRFEPGGGVALTAPRCRPHVARTATSRRRERWAQGWHVSITGDVGVYVGPEAMGIDTHRLAASRACLFAGRRCGVSGHPWRHPWQVYRCARTVHQPLTAVCSHRWEVTAWWHARLMWDRPGWHHDVRPTPAHPEHQR